MEKKKKSLQNTPLPPSTHVIVAFDVYFGGLLFLLFAVAIFVVIFVDAFLCFRVLTQYLSPPNPS